MNHGPVQPVITLCLLMMMSCLLYAANDHDIRLRPQQNLLQQHTTQQQVFQQQQPADQLPMMIVEDNIININNKLHDLGQALYLAVIQKQCGLAVFLSSASSKVKAGIPILAFNPVHIYLHVS